MAHEESSIGRFLRDGSRVDTTRAGCMLAATGKTMAFAAQQRIQLREPLVRLYKDVETFQYRAVTDTYDTIEKMEKSRTAYRAALLWMKDVSQKLDPDAYKQLDKFRKVQAHVRRCKGRFEKIKLDTHQKIDMLCASRVNMLSHSLTMYQNGLLAFFEKTADTMNAVSDVFVGYQYFESNLLSDIKDGKRQNVDESLKKEIESKLSKIFSDDSTRKATPAPDLDNKPVSITEIDKDKSEPDQLLDISSSARGPHEEPLPAPARPQAQDDFLTDFDPSEKELLSELFAVCQPPTLEPNSVKDEKSSSHCHLPSHLVEEFSQMKASEKVLHRDSGAASADSRPVRSGTENAWLNLFSELDPLSNPDAVGKTAEDDRNC